MDFYKRVEAVCREVPYGRAATYGQIALLCGKPGNARQVGYALGHKVSDVPAYRVVNAKGALSGAAAFEIPGIQRHLLEIEGIRLDADEHVDLDKFGWKNTLEDALKLLEFFEKNDL